MGFAEKMNSMPKYVVSTTLRKADWNNTTILSEDVVARVRELKAQTGQNILMYGSATLMRSLMEHDLVDEFLFLLSPVILGTGARVFPEDSPAQALEAEGSTTLSGGMTLLRFKPAAAPATA